MALPPTIQTIVDLIGYGPAMELVRRYGGRDFRFPTSRGSDAWADLVELLGARASSKLVDHYRGEEIYIALCTDALRNDRNRQIIARYDALLIAGRSGRAAVAILVGEFAPISNRTVEKVVNGPAPSAAPEMVVQGCLF